MCLFICPSIWNAFNNKWYLVDRTQEKSVSWGLTWTNGAMNVHLVLPSCFKFLFYCIFSITIYPSCILFLWQSPHYYPCPWVLFPFCSIPPPPNLPTQCCQHTLYLWVSVLLFSSLDSIYEWNHMVFVFLSLAYFT